MPKFRRKPIVVEAVQWLAGDPPLLGMIESTSPPDSHSRYVIPTLEGVESIYPGDWIVTSAEGERRLCRADKFAARYEPVDDA
jgi:hypothetical protein